MFERGYPKEGILSNRFAVEIAHTCTHIITFRLAGAGDDAVNHHRLSTLKIDHARCCWH